MICTHENKDNAIQSAFQPAVAARVPPKMINEIVVRDQSNWKANKQWLPKPQSYMGLLVVRSERLNGICKVHELSIIKLPLYKWNANSMLKIING